MLVRILLYAAAALLVMIPAAAQWPVFEPDDFVDPALHDGALFLSRVAAGGVANRSDHYRPRDGNAGFVLFTNSLYVGRLQFDYKHRELFGEDDARLQRCDCPEPVYFPTPPPGNATPESPPPGRSDTLQMALYHTSGDASSAPSTLRTRLRWSRQKIDTVVTAVSTGRVLERRSGHDQSFTFDTDTHFRIAGREFWGSLYFARTSRSGTQDDRAQNVFAYVSRFPGWAAGPVLFRTTLTVGGITHRGTRGVNVIHPHFEAYWRHEKTKANFHLAWSAEGMRSAAEGWRINHQVAIFLDRTLYVKVFGRPRDE